MSDLKKGNIAVIEMKSIARGVAVTDSMAKAARVSTVLSTSLCPGKYLAIIEGELGALDSAVRIAEKIGGRHIFSSFIIGGLNTRVIEAISGKHAGTALDAMGIIESMQIANLINSSDIPNHNQLLRELNKPDEHLKCSASTSVQCFLCN